MLRLLATILLVASLKWQFIALIDYTTHDAYASASAEASLALLASAMLAATA